jgi:hypothetical protein
LAFACTLDDAIVVEDHFFDYEIEEVPVEINYLVGAHYSRFVWNSNVPEEPTLGRYDANKGDPTIYAQHVQQAQAAGIDYFLLGLRSSKDMAAFKADSVYIDTLQLASNASELNFAISYNFGSMGLADNKRIEDVGLVPTFLKDFEMMLPWFQKSNYMKVDGKSVVYMLNSHNLFANDNVALYKQLRDQMSALGVELFIIGMQNEWTPPLRYDFRFINCVDALTHTTYTNINITWWDRYASFHKMIDQAWSYHQATLGAYNVEYVPTISPSNNPKITNPGSTNMVIEKDMEWFSGNCNVARKISGSHNLVLLDSFNDWNRGTQIESAASYNVDYLNTLRQEFKVN